MLDALRNTLRDRIGSQRYATWFDGSVELSSTGGEVRISAASAFERDLIRKQFADETQQAVQSVYGETARVTFVVNETAATNAQSPTEPGTAAIPKPHQVPKPHQARRAKPQPSGSRQGPAPTQQPTPRPRVDPLAGWVEGGSNLEATGLCRGIASGRHAASPVLVWGPSGSGKTHLLRAIASGVRNGNRKRRVLTLTAEQFLIAFVEAIRGGGLPSFRQKHRGVDLLVVDNVQQLLGKQRTVEEFLLTLDTLMADGAQIVLSADRGPSELRELGPELASRLAGGVSAELRLPDSATRKELIHLAARQRQLELPADMIETLAGRLIGGAREVQGALNRIELLVETFAVPRDNALAQRVADELNRVSTPPVRMNDIERAVCGVFGVEAAALKSSKRTKAVTEPRMLAMWLSRKLTGSAWSEIGDYYGRRSHSTVISAHRRVESLLAGSQPARLSTPAAGDLGDAIRRVEAALRMA